MRSARPLPGVVAGLVLWLAACAAGQGAADVEGADAAASDAIGSDAVPVSADVAADGAAHDWDVRNAAGDATDAGEELREDASTVADASLEVAHDTGVDTDADPWECERRWDFWWTSGYCLCDGSLPACCSSFSHEGVLAECHGVTPRWRLEYFHDEENGCVLAGSDEIPLCPWM